MVFRTHWPANSVLCRGRRRRDAQPLALFVASTTGTGVEPDNMRRFWRFLLRRNLPTDSLARLRFSVFGLGDSSYPKFNFAAKKLQKRLEGLGATCAFPLGLADDQHDLGVDGALEPWLEGVWARVLQMWEFAATLPPPHANTHMYSSFPKMSWVSLSSVCFSPGCILAPLEVHSVDILSRCNTQCCVAPQMPHPRRPGSHPGYRVPAPQVPRHRIGRRYRSGTVGGANHRVAKREGCVCGPFADKPTSDGCCPFPGRPTPSF